MTITCVSNFVFPYGNIASFSLKWSEVKSLSCARLFATPYTIAYKAPLSMEFSRQEYWSGLPFPSPRDLPEPRSPALQADALPSEPPGKPPHSHYQCLNKRPKPLKLLLNDAKCWCSLVGEKTREAGVWT